MKTPARHTLPSASSDSGSSLILTLLLVAILSLVAVGFLSTAKIEVQATRNFSRQNAAAGLAELATQQAMAQIQKGFTANGTGTTVITTQPGAIRQFVFSNGTIISNSTTELFSGGNNSTATKNGTANLNNLQNPGNTTALTSNASNNRWTITGFANQTILVPLEEIVVSENGTNRVVGRVAYYVDDEGTKLNVNAATGDRPTLNVGGSRSLSLSSIASASQSSNFTAIVNGSAGNGPGDPKNWAGFFRPEQVGAVVSGFGQGDTPKLSTAPVGRNNDHLKKTPWGTSRLFINDLPTDTANAPASVNAIYNALNSPQLRDIYGATFADKYTDLGLKQIAANILQMRDPNTNTVNASFTSTVPRIGADASQLVSIANCCPTAAANKKIPGEYFGRAPYAYINEVGVMLAWGANSDVICFQTVPFISILNPEQFPIPESEVSKWRIDAMIDSYTMDITYLDTSGNIIGPITYGPLGFRNSIPDSFGHTSSERWTNLNKRNSALGGLTDIKEWVNYYHGGGYSMYSNGTLTSLDGTVNLGAASAWAKTLNPGEELQLGLYEWRGSQPWSRMQGLQLQFPATKISKIISINNINVIFEYITLSTVSGNSVLIRDFVLGSETGNIKSWLQAPFTIPGSSTVWPMGFPDSGIAGAHPLWSAYNFPPDFSIKRIDGRIRFSANMTTNATGNSTFSATQRSYMRAWSANGAQSWPTKNPITSFATNTAVTTNTDAYPSNTSGHPIPGDPVPTQSSPFYDYPAPFASTLQFIGANLTTANSSVFTSPQELGKVHTNVQHRKLRFTPQHPNEVATGSGGAGNQTFIPDWAMLDVISFGSNVTSVPAPAPVNLNGRFHVPSGSPQIAPRMAALESALKALDSATSVGNPFNSSNTSTTNRTQYMGGGTVSATIAGNIGNLNWSTGNFTAGSATWGRGNSTNDPGSRRKTAGFPAGQFVLPAEVTEIRSMADAIPLDNYSSTANIKSNEGRLSAIFPGATTQSRFFTVYAYAQALDKQGNIDSEALTKALVEVEEQTPATNPPTYKVKKLYTQPINAQ